MKKLGSGIRRSVVALTLPLVMSACTTWQRQDVASLPDLIARDQPDKVRLRTRSDIEFDLEDPQMDGDKISGFYRSIQVVGVPLADIAEASVERVSLASLGLTTLGVAALVSFIGAKEPLEEPGR
jgi:hypothetical protein